MALDASTLLVAIACASLFSAALLIAIYRINPAEVSIIYWGSGNFLFGAGSMLDALYPVIGPEITSILVNLTQTVGFALLASGLMRFLNRNPHPPLISAYFAIQLAIHCWFVFVTPLLWVRIVNTSVFMVVVALWPLAALRSGRRAIDPHSVAVPFLRLGFSLLIISYALWLGYALRMQPLGLIISIKGQIISVSLLQLLCTIVILNISFVLLVMERIHRLLSHRAAVDDLTGVFNRRAFNQIAEAELARADRYHVWPALMVLDLDHFKSVNDRFGHAAGDEVLRRFGTLVKSCLRAGDIVARMGGEEFAALLPSTDLDRATAVAERIRATLAAEEFEADGQTFHVTTSIGLTIILPHDTLHCAFARADAALYAAKDAGRNRVLANTLTAHPAEASGDAAGPARPAAPPGLRVVSLNSPLSTGTPLDQPPASTASGI